MTVYSYTVKRPTGEEVSLQTYRGHMLLIVNTATKCGFSSQLRELEQLYETYKDKGFIVLGFPCNQFLNQEPLSNEEIEETCERTYGVTFPLFAKVKVNGEDADPLYTYLKKEQKGIFGEPIVWNFTKFLVDTNGSVIKRFGPAVRPTTIETHIRKRLP